MMARRPLLGILLGACMAGWASLLEALSLYPQFPYHADPWTWATLLPSYLLAGAALGLLASPALNLVCRRAHREEEPGLHLGLFLLCLGWWVVAVALARMSLDTSIPTLSGQALGRFALASLWPLAAYLLGYRLIRSPLGWAFAPFTRPLAVGLSLLILGVLALLSHLLPVRTAEVSDHHAAAPAPKGSPNVLFVVLDTVAADHLGCYGHYRPTSPRLDGLAEEGALFENAFSAAPWTLPSHASMFTSLLPNLHGTGWQRPRLSDGLAAAPKLENHDYHTLAEEMAQRGYDTCGAAEKSWLSHTAGLTQGFHSYYDYSRPSLRDTFFLPRLWARYRDKFGRPAPPAIGKGGARVVDTALDWLGGNRARDEDRPFFLFMNLNEAHDPYLPPAEVKGKFRPDGATEADFLELKPHNVTESHRDIVRGDFLPTPLQWEIYKSLYDEEILYQDGLLGRLFDGLSELGLMEDTLVIVTADHGEEFGEFDHRAGHQLSLSDRLIHVPLIMRYPKRIPAGRRVQAMASTLDIFPTILDLVEQEQGIKWPKSRELMAIQGVSQLASMQPDGAPARDFIMAHYFNPTPYLTGYSGWNWSVADGGALPPEVTKTMRSIDVLRSADAKLYLYGDGQRAFVDLKADPTEGASEAEAIAPAAVALASQYELRFQRQLNSAVVAYEKWVGHFAWYRRAVKQTPLVLQATGGQGMEALGYVGGSDGGSEDNLDLSSAESYQLPPFLKLRR